MNQMAPRVRVAGTVDGDVFPAYEQWGILPITERWSGSGREWESQSQSDASSNMSSSISIIS